MSSLAASSFGNPPAGYISPSFPSLLWTADDRANGALLYYTKDIVRFTIFWTLILVGGMYGAVGLIAGYSHRRITGGVGILAIYLLLGALHAILGGTFSGLMYVEYARVENARSCDNKATGLTNLQNRRYLQGCPDRDEYLDSACIRSRTGPVPAMRSICGTIQADIGYRHPARRWMDRLYPSAASIRYRGPAAYCHVIRYLVEHPDICC